MNRFKIKLMILVLLMLNSFHTNLFAVDKPDVLGNDTTKTIQETVEQQVADSANYVPCPCNEYDKTWYFAQNIDIYIKQKRMDKWKFNFIDFPIDVEDYSGPVEDSPRYNAPNAVNAKMNTMKDLRLRFNYNSCVTLDLAPCRKEKVFATIPTTVYYVKGKPKSLEVELFPQTVAIRFNPDFLMQLDENKQAIDKTIKVPATFLLNASSIIFNYEKNVQLIGQKIKCTSSYSLSGNSIVISVRHFLVDLSKEKNSDEFISIYLQNHSYNSARETSLVDKKKLLSFTGIYSNNSTVSVPIAEKQTMVDFKAKELILGDYFMASVLTIGAEKNGDGKYQIKHLNENYSFSEEELRDLFAKLDVKTGNYYYNIEKQELLFDVYYEKKN